MKKIMIILNSIVYNRGSEALVSGLSQIIKEKYGNEVFMTLVSSEDNFDKNVNINGISNYLKKYNFKSKSIIEYFTKIISKLKLYNIEVKLRYSKLLKEAKKQDLVIIIGADNYDITYNMQKKINILHTYFKKNDVKMLLYDCSIDKQDITNIFKNDINNFEAITVRETISLENVKKLKDNIYLYPDPAFVMEPKQIKLPQIFNNSKVIGLNSSNLILNGQYGSNSKIIIKSYIKLIKYILNNTDYKIILIPHVMKQADLSTLKIIYKEFEDNDRVCLVKNEKLNARELKYIISNCYLFIGARTHSTIAAYSSRIPTLVLGYSIKSKGIAKDIFGKYEKYVLPVSELDNDEYLINGFKWLTENESDIRKILNNNMDNYINNAKRLFNLLEKLLK